jgi:membrane fusion protein, multidrug efflux system
VKRWLIRYIYLFGIMSFLGWIGNSLAGGYLYTRADGMVVGDAGTVSPEYTVTVLEVLVQNGQKVERGDVIARVSSSRVAELNATLSGNSSTLVSRMAEITAKASMIDQLVNAADARERLIEANSEQLSRIKEKGFLPLMTQNALIEQVFRGKQELAVLRAEKETMSRQVAQIVAASRNTDQAIEDLATLFDAGRMKSPMTGYVAGVDVGVGAVVNPGEVIADLVGEHRFVLAYYPIDRLFEVKEGAPVTIDVGFGNWLHGKIHRIEPIAARLPKEFQRTLSPVERHQLVRVEFDPDTKLPPYFTKVVVR